MDFVLTDLLSRLTMDRKTPEGEYQVLGQQFAVGSVYFAGHFIAKVLVKLQAQCHCVSATIQLKIRTRPELV